MKCKRCSAEFSDGNFCPQCGLPVSDNEKYPPAPEEQEQLQDINEAALPKLNNDDYGDSFDEAEGVDAPQNNYGAENYRDNYSVRGETGYKANYVYPNNQPKGNNFPKDEKKGVKGFIIAIVVLVVVIIGVAVALIFSLIGGCSNAVKDLAPTNPTSATQAAASAPTDNTTAQPPTEAPTQAQTPVPTEAPTQQAPTQAPPPTEAPTQAPTQPPVPTEAPTEAPTQSTVPEIV